jgi:hypothetical protein
VTREEEVGDAPVLGRHWEYQALEKTQVAPATHVVAPLQPCPPPLVLGELNYLQVLRGIQSYIVPIMGIVPENGL